MVLYFSWEQVQEHFVLTFSFMVTELPFKSVIQLMLFTCCCVCNDPLSSGSSSRMNYINWLSISVSFVFLQNFAAQMAGGFDEKAGGAQMGVMQGPMVSERWWDLLPFPCSLFCFFYSQLLLNLFGCYSVGGVSSEEILLGRLLSPPRPELKIWAGISIFPSEVSLNETPYHFQFLCAWSCTFTFLEVHKQLPYMNHRNLTWLSNVKTTTSYLWDEEIPMKNLKSSRMGGNMEGNL